MPFPVRLLIIMLTLLIWSNPVAAEDLLDYVRRALTKSNTAYDLLDSRDLKEMNLNAAQHEFDYRIIPLSNIGFSNDSASQAIGIEVNQKLTTGTTVSAGVRGDRINPNSGYVIDEGYMAKAYVQVSQGLFQAWGKKYNLTPTHIAEFRVQEQLVKNERERQELIKQTATLYYNLALYKMLLETTKESVKRAAKHLEAAKAKQSIGMVSKLDVYRAELALLGSENSVQQHGLELRRAMDSFLDLLSFEDSDDVKIPEKINWLNPVIPSDWESALLENRADWRAHLIQKEIARLALYKAERELDPDISLDFSLGQRGAGNSAQDASELDETDWSVQLQMQYDLDRFSEKQNYSKELIAIRKLRREGESLKKKIFRQAREAFETLTAQKRVFDINERQLKQAADALELANIRYDKGLSDNLDVMDAESAYATAQTAIARAIGNYNIAAVNLAYNLGVLNMDWLSLSITSAGDKL